MNDRPLATNMTVDSEEFHQHIPGLRHSYIGHEKWNSLSIDFFTFPGINGGDVLAPPLNEPLYAFAGSLGTTKKEVLYHGVCKLNDQIQFNGNKYQGKGFLIPRLHTACWDWRSESGQDFQGSCVYFPPRLLEKVALEALGKDANSVELKLNMDVYDEFIHAVLSQLAKDPHQSSPINRVYAETLTQAFAVHILKHYCTFEHKVPDYQKGLPAYLLNRVIDFMHERIADSLGLDELASVAGLSSYYFSRLFKQSTGKSPHQYLVELRIERAKTLLSSTEDPIINIALSTGYANPASFSYTFKRVVGVSPRDYRRYK